MYRTWVILRHTFLDCLVQPIFGLMLLVGVVILGLFYWLPFFTLGEDSVMFKSVGLDIINLLVLVVTLFATSRSIFDEIEDRSMLTLMSKPVSKWEVLLGKYLGIICSALLAVAVLGLVLCLATYARIPRDYTLNVYSLDDIEATRLRDLRVMHLAGLIPSLILSWMQISVLSAIGVALSTRFALVVNLPAVIIVYIAGNLTRFLEPIWDTVPGSALHGESFPTKALAQVLVVVLPYLEHFDLRQATVTGKIAFPGTEFVTDQQAYSYGGIWLAVGVALLYAICYSGFALLGGMVMFRNRELGGAEG